MTEDEAREWLRDRFGEEALARLSAYVALLIVTNRSQNLISRSSEATIWVRHIVDSAQLALLAPDAADWLDIGSGAGLPGIVLSIVTGKPVTLVESRRMRVEFLETVKAELNLTNCNIVQRDIAKLPTQKFDAVTARAVAALRDLLSLARPYAHPDTIWILPKGRSYEAELANARDLWHGMFHVEHSLSDPDARIIVASQIEPR